MTHTRPRSTRDGTEEGRGRLRTLLGLDGPAPTATAIPATGPAAAPAASGLPGPSTTGRLVDPPEREDDGPQLVTVRTGSGVELPAFLLRPAPERATGAAVVLVAGHGPGIDGLVAEDPADEYHDRLAHKLVARGVTVLAPEMLSFGRRRTESARPDLEPAGPGDSSCGIDAARFLLHGRPVMGQRVADAAAAADALRALPGVDPERVAVAGGSGGGAVALLLAAAESGTAGALVANYFSSFAASIAAIRHCPCNIVPGLLPDLEMADIAALIAPRPLVIEAGEEDPIFPIAATRAAHAGLAPAWSAQGAEPPTLVVTPGGHAFRGEESVERLLALLG